MILCALVLSGASLRAATRESRAYAAALADAQDKMWSRAETEFAGFVKRFPESTNAPMAVLLEAQAQFQQAKYDEAQALLTDTNNLALAASAGIADQYARWTGEAQFAAGQYDTAASTFIQAARDYPKSSLALPMVVSAAAAYEKLKAWGRLDALLEATNGIFQKTLQMDPDNPQVVGGRLLLVRSKVAQAKYPEALAILNSLNPHLLSPDQEGNRSQQLYEVMMAMGNEEGALAATTNLMAVNDSVLRSGGVAAHALLLEKKGQLAAAMAAWSGNLVPGVPLDRQREAILKIADLAAAQYDFTNAASSLDDYLARFPDSPLAEMTLLTSGEMYLKNFVYSGLANLAAVTPAQTRFTSLLDRSTNSPFAGKAFLDRGWCEWFAGKYPESAADFRQATDRLQSITDRAVATFKLGDAFYAQGQYESARESYQNVLDVYANVPEVMQSLEERALYQVLRASLELKDGPAAELALRELLKRYPTGGDAAAALLLAGESFSDFSSPAGARKVLLQFESQFPNSTLKPDVEFAIARTYENEGDWPEAVAHHDAWLKSYPGNGLWPQVLFALGRANFQAGNEARAFGVFTNFVASFPTNQLAPMAQMWVGDHFYRTGDFVGAETNYEAVFQSPIPIWQTNSLVFLARAMAGRAAMGRQGYKEAAAYFGALIDNTNCPPELGVEARFALGAALMNEDSSDTNNLLANVQNATNVFSQIVAMYPTNQYGARAWGEIGDCDMVLGDLDAATNAYSQALALDAAEISVHSAAKIGFGMALEKKAKLLTGAEQRDLLQLALNNYLDLMREKESDFWVKKAGLQAAGVAETLQDWSTALTIYNRLKQDLPQLTEEMNKKIAAAKAQLALKKL